MTDAAREPNDSTALDERLVAYLDRELPDAECEEIERRLAADADLRDRLSGLDRVWNALDAAPRTTTADRDFANTTVAVVVSDAEKLNAKRPRRWRWKPVLATFGAVAVGFLAVRGFSTRGERQLVLNLPAIRYAAALGQAGDEDYLRRVLRESPGLVESVEPLGLRAEAEEWGEISTALPPERGRWLAERSDTEQDDLVERAIAFRAQAPARSRRLVELERRIRGHDDAERLRLAALSHHALLSVLPAGDRAAFLSLPAEERVSELKSNLKRWSQRALMRLTDSEAAEFREGVMRLAEGDSVASAVERFSAFAARVGDRRGDSRGRFPDRLRERGARMIATRAEQFRDHPEQMILAVATAQSRGESSRFLEAFLNAPTPQARWAEWEARLVEALPARARQVIESEKRPRQRARLLLDPLERVAAPTRPGEASRYFAEELTNRELQDYLAMPVTEMQDKLRDRIAEESLGGPLPTGLGEPRRRGRGDPPDRRPERDGRRGFRPPPPPDSERPRPGPS